MLGWRWNGGGFGWAADAEHSHREMMPTWRGTPDDLVSLNDLVNALAIPQNIDTNRIYVTGLSIGGYMVHRIGCDADCTFQHPPAAYASISGSLYNDNFKHCASRMRATLMLQSATDGVYQGRALDWFSGEELTAYLGDAGQCTGPSIVTQGSLTFTTYTGCTGGATVQQVVNDGGQHVVVYKGLNRPMFKDVVDFFKAH